MATALWNEMVVLKAFELVRPVFDRLVEMGLTGGRKTLCVVVLNAPENDRVFAQVVWGEDDASSWPVPYDDFAREKAKVTARTGMVGRTLQREAPWLYKMHDSLYAGGIIENGLVVAASGLQDYWDEAISWMVLDAIQALCRGEMADLPPGPYLE